MCKVTTSKSSDDTGDTSSTTKGGELDSFAPVYQALSKVFPQSLRDLIARAITYLGNSKESLSATWVGHLCILNAFHHLGEIRSKTLDKMRFSGPDGKVKRGAFGVMNLKYRNFLYAALGIHIVGGTLSVLGSALAIYFEERNPKLSRKIATVASAGETFLHAPSAIILSPYVYGDKGITPFLYMVTSGLLQLSGAAALIESISEESPGPNEELKLRRPELRRMSTTVGIFIYVRLYALVRGLGGYLQPQKYALATLIAGTTMLPIGWSPFLFPTFFYMLAAYNWRTARETMRLADKFGVDKASLIQARSLSPLYR